MDSQALVAPGKLLASDEELTLLRARQMATFLRGSHSPYARLVEYRRCATPLDGDVVVVDLIVERPQRTHNNVDIRPEERVALIFWDDDTIMPWTLALRADFPRIPHMNLGREELPRSLCLYEIAWREIAPRWTARGWIERVRQFLAQAADGTLHDAAQALEPLLFHTCWPLVLPETVMAHDNAEAPVEVQIHGVDGGLGRTVLIAEHRQGASTATGGQPFIALVLHGDPQVHGTIHREPRNLADLTMFLSEAGIDLRATLRAHLKDWATQPKLLERQLILIVRLPKRRHADGDVENVELRALLVGTPIGALGEAVGLWVLQDGVPGVLIVPDDTKVGDDVGVMLLDPVTDFSRTLAARANGHAAPVDRRIVAVGLGALGSQVFTTLARQGWGEWALVDDDCLLPHNLARHALFGFAVGRPKATMLAQLVNDTVAGPPIARAFVADVLSPSGAGDELEEALARADGILDMSASVPVARALVGDIASEARRLSLFLNPSATSLVVLAEDRARSIPLDSIEMQYYRAIVTEPRLAGHLRVGVDPLRYGQSCRAVSTQLPQEHVALLAAIGSRAIRTTMDQPEARVDIWTIDPATFAVSHLGVTPAPWREWVIGSWRVRADGALLERLRCTRAEKLPAETGGVLVGTLDRQRGIIYVVESIPAPPDSIEWPTSYVRGIADLPPKLEHIGDETGEMLHYIGEWHSHPRGAGVTPSATDRRAFAQLAEVMALDGLPPLFLIVGDDDEWGWHVEEVA